MNSQMNSEEQDRKGRRHGATADSQVNEGNILQVKKVTKVKKTTKATKGNILQKRTVR